SRSAVSARISGGATPSRAERSSFRYSFRHSRYSVSIHLRPESFHHNFKITFSIREEILNVTGVARLIVTSHPTSTLLSERFKEIVKIPIKHHINPLLTGSICNRLTTGFQIFVQLFQ